MVGGDDSDDEDTRTRPDSVTHDSVILKNTTAILPPNKQKKLFQHHDGDKTNHEQIFIFALLWSLGAFLEDHDRHRFFNI